VGVKVRFGFGLGIIFLTFKTFGNNFNISHRKAPLPISSAARLDDRKDTVYYGLSSGHAYIHIHVADDALCIADVDAGDDPRGEE
jgi:hypothetical protein